MAIGIALLGAGIFAREEHLPAIKACSNLELKAVYSRSQESADNIAKEADQKVDVYYDKGSSSAQNLDALLSREDIQAVVIAVPIPNQPALIKKALGAGKHVLSEKPIAKDVSTALELIKWYEGTPRENSWVIGENLRFWHSVTRAAEILRNMDAKLETFSTNINIFVDENDKYFQTSWRATPEYQGGFLLDGGVHFVAAMRYLLAALGQKVTLLTAVTSLIKPMLLPVDTVQAVWKVTNGTCGTFNCSFGIEFKSGFGFEVVTDKGSVAVKMDEVVTTVKDESGAKKESTEKVGMTMGVKEEIAAFANGLQSGEMDPRLLPAEALVDLQLLEAMLKSNGLPITFA